MFSYAGMTDQNKRSSMTAWILLFAHEGSKFPYGERSQLVTSLTIVLPSSLALNARSQKFMNSTVRDQSSRWSMYSSVSHVTSFIDWVSQSPQFSNGILEKPIWMVCIITRTNLFGSIKEIYEERGDKEKNVRMDGWRVSRWQVELLKIEVDRTQRLNSPDIAQPITWFSRLTRQLDGTFNLRLIIK